MSYTSTPSIISGRPPNIKFTGALPSVTTPGTYSAVAGLSVKEYGDSVLRTVVIRLDGVSVTMTDSTTNNGNVPIYALPRGNVYIFGGTANFSSKTYSNGAVDAPEPFTNTPGLTAGSGGIADGAALVYSIGTVVGAGATLTSTEANVLASVAATLTAGTTTSTGLLSAVSLTGGVSTGGSQPYLFLNFAVPDADSSASDTLTVTGEIILTYIVLGNY